MEQKTPKFRLRLNLFDGLVLVVALAVGAVLLWMTLKPAPTAEEPAAATSTVRYVVRFQRWIEGTGELIEPGDKLVDNIKNYDIGQVVSAQIVPAEAQQFDREGQQYIQAIIPQHEDILVTVEAPCTVDDTIVLSGGYTLRVGSIAYIRGEGYMASGPIVSIEREGLE